MKLKVRPGWILLRRADPDVLLLDTEDLSSEELAQFGLQRKTSSQLSNHRPLVVEYTWFE